MTKAGLKTLPMPGDKLRCNLCGGLFLEHNVSPQACRCGCKVWVCSRVTWPERLGLALGLIKDADPSIVRFDNKPVGGRAEDMNRSWEK